MSDDLIRESLEELYQDAPCGYIFTRPDGTFVRFNRTFLQWTGYDADHVTGKRFQDLLTIPGRIFYENQYVPLLHLQGAVTEISFDLRCSDGRRLPVLVNSTMRRSNTGQSTIIASTIFDASERERYEHELRAARERAEQLAAIVTSASDAIVRASIDGTIETWNRGAEALFGYSARDATGLSLWQVIPVFQHDADRESVVRELQSGRPVYLDGQGQCADERLIDISIGLMPHAGLLGELVAVSAIMRDISQRRELERLQQEFIAMTSHELRHPLTNIKGQAQMMRRRERYSEQAIDSIVHQVDHLNRLIDDLLLASLIEADRFTVRLEPINLTTTVRRITEQMQTGEHAIHLELPTNEVIVRGDEKRLDQALANLISNAAKYSPLGEDVVVRVWATTDEASVAVIDQGIGIPPERIPRLFTRFYRAEESSSFAQGLGLGLYITDQIVRAHGGSISVQSDIGVGSTFTIALPRVVTSR